MSIDIIKNLNRLFLISLFMIYKFFLKEEFTSKVKDPDQINGSSCQNKADGSRSGIRSIFLDRTNVAYWNPLMNDINGYLWHVVDMNSHARFRGLIFFFLQTLKIVRHIRAFVNQKHIKIFCHDNVGYWGDQPTHRTWLYCSYFHIHHV